MLEKIKEELLKHENVGLIVAEILNPTLIGDLGAHEVHNIKKLFIKDFIHTEEKSLLEEMNSFAKDSTHALKNDLKFIKNIFCAHKKHPDLLKKVIEESLLEDGLERAAIKGLVSVVEIETIPEIIGAYAFSKAFKELAISTFGDKLKTLRESFFGKTNNEQDDKPKP